MENGKHVFAAATVAGGLAFALSTLPELALATALDRLVDGGATWLPAVGSIGVTATLYTYVVGILTALGVLVPGFVLGALLARRHDVRADFRRFVRALVAGSAAGVFLVGALAVLLGMVLGGGSFDASGFFGMTVAFLVLALLRAFVEVALVVAVAALAGVAVDSFTTGPDRPERTATGATAPRGPPSDD